MVGACLSAWSYHRAQQRDYLVQLERLEILSDELLDEVENILAAQQYLMLGVRALFDSSETVTRAEFQQYFQSVDLRGRFQGVYAMGWNRQVTRDQISEFERSVRNDTSINATGYPQFRIRPPTQNHTRHVVTFAEPMAGNEDKLGFDLGSHPARAKALEYARDTGEFAATAPIDLVGTQGAYKGFLLFLPVYSNPDVQSLPERRGNYLGSLSGVFKVPGLMQQSSQSTFTAVQLFDVSGLTGAGSDHWRETIQGDPFYSVGQFSSEHVTLERSILVGGRQWSFLISMDTPALNALSDTTAVWIVPSMGLLISLVLSLWMYSLITARDRARRQAINLSTDLIRVNRNLERSNNDLSQFAYVASHDLQTPVRNVDLSVTLLESALANRMNSQVREYLDYLKSSSQRMQKLVEDLLAFARVDRESLEFQVIDLEQVCQELVSRMSRVIDEHDVTVNIEPLPQILGDQNQIERLFMNLVSNAIRYRHADRQPVITLQSTMVDDRWFIRVIDNGIGIEPRFHEKVFEPFKRLHSHDAIAGSGLGLGICRQIVDSHGGSLSIKCSSSQGTTFEFSLPVVQAFQQAA